MSSSIVDLCNSALALMSEYSITDINDSSNKVARLCRASYYTTVNEVLRTHLWNSAIKRVEIAQETTAPSFEFCCQYQLPVDCLRVLKIQDNPIYKLEGKKILTDNTDCFLKYIAVITDPNLMDSLLQEAVSTKLAMKISFALTNSVQMKNQLKQDYEDILSRARSIDAMEDTPTSFSEGDSTWLDAFDSGSY